MFEDLSIAEDLRKQPKISTLGMRIEESVELSEKTKLANELISDLRKQTRGNTLRIKESVALSKKTSKIAKALDINASRLSKIAEQKTSQRRANYMNDLLLLDKIEAYGK